MLKNFFYASLALLAVGCGSNSGQKGAPAIAPDADLESQVKKIVSGLTLEQKVGQMCEVTIDEVLCDSLVKGSVALDEAKIKKVIGEYQVGSVLNVPMGMAQTPETW